VSIAEKCMPIEGSVRNFVCGELTI
jgi:hypothetical protein